MNVCLDDVIIITVVNNFRLLSAVSQASAGCFVYSILSFVTSGPLTWMVSLYQPSAFSAVISSRFLTHLDGESPHL